MRYLYEPPKEKKEPSKETEEKMVIKNFSKFCFAFLFGKLQLQSVDHLINMFANNQS